MKIHREPIRGPRTRQDLITKIRNRVNRLNAFDSRMLAKVLPYLEAKDWRGALTEARTMDTTVREEIPQWGWDLMRSADAAITILEVLG